MVVRQEESWAAGRQAQDWEVGKLVGDLEGVLRAEGAGVATAVVGNCSGSRFVRMVEGVDGIEEDGSFEPGWLAWLERALELPTAVCVSCTRGRNRW